MNIQILMFTETSEHGWAIAIQNSRLKLQNDTDTQGYWIRVCVSIKSI
jgi:hypothetical protein